MARALELGRAEASIVALGSELDALARVHDLEDERGSPLGGERRIIVGWRVPRTDHVSVGRDARSLLPVSRVGGARHEHEQRAG